MYLVWFGIYLLKKILDKLKEIQKSTCKLKEYYIWRFSKSILDHEKRRKIISYSILFGFYDILKFLRLYDWTITLWLDLS